MDGWPRTREELIEAQRQLAAAAPPRWDPLEDAFTIGAVFATFSTARDPGSTERAWVAATLGPHRALVTGVVADEYEAGFLALREGRLLERAVRALPERPDVLLVNATGRDHPRGAGLALQLGAVLDLPTVGVTDRPLIATADQDGRLLDGGEVVGHLVRTRPRVRPVAAHAAWRTDADVARFVVLAAAGAARTPEPLRRARFLARSQRARDEGRIPPGWQMDQLTEPRFPRR